MSKPPLDDPRVRQALNLGIDKQQLVASIRGTEVEPATHYVPDFTGSGYAAAAAADRAAGRDPFAGPGLEFDASRARALLGEAGYHVTVQGDEVRTADFPALELLYNTGEGHQKIAVVVQDMWRRYLGVSVAVRSEEWKVMLQNIRAGNFQIAQTGGGDAMDQLVRAKGPLARCAPHVDALGIQHQNIAIQAAQGRAQGVKAE